MSTEMAAGVGSSGAPAGGVDKMEMSPVRRRLANGVSARRRYLAGPLDEEPEALRGKETGHVATDCKVDCIPCRTAAADLEALRAIHFLF